MKIFKKLALAIASFMTLLFIVGLLLPQTWKVERSIVINSPPVGIYPFIADFKNGWPRWSAFDYEDPNITFAYSGADQGYGARREWKSETMGNGWMTITASNIDTGIDFELGMENGFFINGKLALAPSPEGTMVTWTDTGDVGFNPLKRLMAATMDKMMGPTFERSLVKLKTLAETRN